MPCNPIFDFFNRSLIFSAKRLKYRLYDYFSATLALRNKRIQAPSSLQSSGYQEFVTERNTRSGCGIIMAIRPSLLLTAVIPNGEPFGFAGYCSVGLR